MDKVLTPTRVKALRNQPIVDVAMGPHHTMCVTDKGHLIAMGRNSEAQLGKGHARSVSGPEVVKAMTAKEVRGDGWVKNGDSLSFKGALSRLNACAVKKGNTGSSVIRQEHAYTHDKIEGQCLEAFLPI